MLLGKREHAEHTADTRGAFVLMDVLADRADMCTGSLRAGQQRNRARRSAGRSVVVVQAMPAARGAQMLAQELPGLRRKQADVQIIPLHVDALADPAGRRAVVCGFDFNAAIEVHGAFAVPVIPKRFDWERPERGSFLGKHRRDLSFRGAVDARIGPARFPAIQIRLRLLETFKAESSQRCLLRVSDPRFDFAFPIGIADTARERDDAVVREHVAIQRIECGIVDVGREDALFQIVEDDDADGAPESTKRALVQLRPDLRARSLHQQSHRLARAAEREDEEARAAVLARAAIAHHRAVAVVDLAFFARRRRNDDARVNGRMAAQLHDEATDTRVPRGKAVIIDQVLPDGDGVAPPRQRLGDDLPIRLARTGTGRATRRSGRHQVGGHLMVRNGRFCLEVGGHLLRNGRFWF